MATFYKTTEIMNGWTDYTEYRHIMNKDGSISKRSNPVKTGRSHHTHHATCQVRNYQDNVLVSEGATK